MQLKWKKVEDANYDNTPDKAGVYIISTRQKADKQYEVKYVGQASDLKARANEHWSENETNEELKEHIAKGFAMKFSYAEVGKQADRDKVEKFLYDHFNPIYNIISPPGETSEECNLPEVRGRL
jgi:excinuclease UvrABC nuclease subunit